MKEKIKQYLTLIKKYAFYALIIITILNIGLRVNFHFSPPEFRTIEYKLNLCSFYLTGYLAIFWIAFIIIKFLLKIALKDKRKWYEEVFGSICAIASFFGIIAVVLLTLTLILFTVMGQGEEECMERCVLPDKSNYVECANSTCDFPI